MNVIANTIIRRIRAKGRGWVFTPKNFLDIAPRATVDKNLSRLTQKGVIRRVARGVYDFPKMHPKLGALSPHADDLAQAVAQKTGDDIFPSGALAANMLGLSTQVPAKPGYLTNGVSRVRKIANRTIVLKRARVPILSDVPDIVNYVVQALSYLGHDNIDGDVILLCADRLNNRDLRILQKTAHKLPDWLSDIVLKMQKAKDGQIRQTA